jgi:hypothetical protein
MSKSPKKESSTEIIFIDKGEIKEMKRILSSTSISTVFFADSGYQLYSHVDISDGDRPSETST